MEELIIYPHGLGDCLMLTPAIREYYNNFGVKLNIAILERFASSKIFDNNQYVGKVFPVLKDAWNDFSNPTIGFEEVRKQGIELALSNNLTPIFINHPAPKHKILLCADQLQVNLGSTQIDVYISNEDKIIADDLIKKFVGENSYGFVQTHTGVQSKNLPDGFGAKWLRKKNGLEHIIEVGKDFHHLDYNINIQFEILRRASGVCIPDSVFYHACCGLNKDIDFVYFGRGVNVYNRVKNLNENIIERAYFQIPII